jgi:glycerol uptake facilitator-like aquaporin
VARIALNRAVVAELLGTALLLGTVVGSGIMGQRLAGGNDAVALLANSLATSAILYVLIGALGPLSGAHFNPAVSLVMALMGKLSWRRFVVYVPAQLVGAFAGVALAHVMFGLPLWQAGTHIRSSAGEVTAEAVATFGLLVTIVGVSRTAPRAVAAGVACYIGAAYWFTSSTSFANPAVTLARAATDTFASIAPASVPAFLIAQVVGALAGGGLGVWLWKAETPDQGPARAVSLSTDAINRAS